MSVAGDIAPRRRRKRDLARSSVVSSPGGSDRHTHCVIFRAQSGDGYTSPAVDGHTHVVRGLEVLAASGHTHDLSSVRCGHAHGSRDERSRGAARAG